MAYKRILQNPDLRADFLIQDHVSSYRPEFVDLLVQNVSTRELWLRGTLHCMSGVDFLARLPGRRVFLGSAATASCSVAAMTVQRRLARLAGDLSHS